MNALSILKKYWGFESFRPLQNQIVEAVLQKKDVLALLPTGGGKSICFQVPALCMEGVCIVVCPLIALMKDQVEHLNQIKIPAAAIYTGLTVGEIQEIWNQAYQGKIKFLYLSPERLTQKHILERLNKLSVSIFAIDESHCISQWGYDFRPSYLQLHWVRQYASHVPIIALTATATPKVRLDIVEKLLLKDVQIFEQSFERKNIHYVVDIRENKWNQLLKIVQNVGGTGIVYVRTRRETVSTADFLNRKGIPAEYYHAGLSIKERSDKQYRWKHNETRVVVATNAFGMGIDKEDVRFVVHLDLPESIEAYYQEAGRAGRDQKQSYAVLLLHPHDLILFKEKMEDQFPSIDELRAFYQSLFDFLNISVGNGENIVCNFDVVQFCRTRNFPLLKTLSSLKIWAQQGCFILNDAVFLPPKIQFTASVEEIYDIKLQYPQVENLINVFLRSYTHVFEQPVPFSENEIAQKADISVETLRHQVLFLSEKRLVQYWTPTDLPQLEILENRLPMQYLHIDYEMYEKRKKNAWYQMQQMLDYSQLKVCRSVFLRKYLGEIKVEKCGKCDVCLAEKRINQGVQREKQLEREILHWFTSNSVTDISELIQNLSGKFTQKEIVDQLRILRDRDKLNININDVL